MKKWEYWKADLPTGERKWIEFLDSYGEDGWELVAIYNDVAYFKREIQEELSEEELSKIAKRLRKG